MMKITKFEFDKMEADLRTFRWNMEYVGMNKKLSLRKVPIFHSDKLFKTAGHKYSLGDSFTTLPCLCLGQQLVHKIIDELIYCGLRGGD